LKQANFAPNVLKLAGFGPQALKDVGFELKQLLPPLFDVFSLTSANFQPQDIASFKVVNPCLR
jgi:hypothetical protein